jgi:hypothetical protein
MKQRGYRSLWDGTCRDGTVEISCFGPHFAATDEAKWVRVRECKIRPVQTRVPISLVEVGTRVWTGHVSHVEHGGQAWGYQWNQVAVRV